VMSETLGSPLCCHARRALRYGGPTHGLKGAGDADKGVLTAAYKRDVPFDEGYYFTRHAEIIERVWGPIGLEHHVQRLRAPLADRRRWDAHRGCGPHGQSSKSCGLGADRKRCTGS
jgi:hypothetical protein